MPFWSIKSEGTSQKTVDIVQDIPSDVAADSSSATAITITPANVPTDEKLSSIVGENVPNEEPLPVARESFFPSLTPNEV